MSDAIVAYDGGDDPPEVGVRLAALPGGAGYDDEAFRLWLSTVPLFVVQAMLAVWEGRRVNPDTLRLAMPFVEPLKSIRVSA